ncbi:MAG: DUF5007 domain-containing protein [Candidatus Pedobacter colombiensis]|uniref:DUF5007 domain-containing protein n=1 Tax=Candidatus Pedobacter colombiensis TaxID=3121371 RepID=A0AAJ6B6T7_9SPHI|nr:DUF5007 domain-containing protein [Pedobacter sp.]WEK19545.1 MAG: DUF5007 domain-containing protein [Pedobacter sp.]
MNSVTKIMINKKYTLAIIPIIFLIGLLGGCKKFLPTDRDTFNVEARFTQTVYTPVLGRTTLMSNNFDAQSSTLPLTFRIVNPRNNDGLIAAELIKPFDVLVWKKAYTGTEKTLAEIEAKRTIEKHPLFEIREHSGEFIMWAAANDRILKSLPDSGYTFDVEVTNNGGRRYFNNMKLQPYKERAFEPNSKDPITGVDLNRQITPTSVVNMVGERTNILLSPGDMNVYMRKVGEGNSLTFRFQDSVFNAINPNKFNLTKWNTLVHGFDMEKTNTYVRYKVAYPIPLVSIPTQYTSLDGRQASVGFAYERLGFGGIKEIGGFTFNFNIYQQGDWEIIFWFNRDNPRFENE